MIKMKGKSTVKNKNLFSYVATNISCDSVELEISFCSERNVRQEIEVARSEQTPRKNEHIISL